MQCYKCHLQVTTSEIANVYVTLRTMMELLSTALCDNCGIHFSRAASHHRDAEFSAAASRDLSRV